jgi:hypothetical protein
MLRKTSIFLNDADHKRLSAIGKVRGLAPSQLVRIAITEWLERTERKAASAK